MKEIEQEIADAIKKNLPSQVGDVLQERLKTLDRIEAEKKSYEEEIKILNRTVSNQAKTIEEYKQFDTRNGELETREKELEEKENKLEITLLKLQLEEANKRTDLVTSFTSGLVRNTLFRKSIIDSESKSVPVPQPHGGHMMVPSNTTKSFTENSSEE